MNDTFFHFFLAKSKFFANIFRKTLTKNLLQHKKGTIAPDNGKSTVNPAATAPFLFFNVTLRLFKMQYQKYAQCDNPVIFYPT